MKSRSVEGLFQHPQAITLIMSPPVALLVSGLKPDYLAMTTVVQELLSLGKSRFAATRISSLGRWPRMIGQ
jgi:hypothetical protein